MAEGWNFLVAMFQGGGNIPKILPIVGRLVSLGHRVRVLVGPGVRPSRLPVSEQLSRSVRATGAHLVRLQEPDIHPFDAASAAHNLAFPWTPTRLRPLGRRARARLWFPLWFPHWAHEVAAELRCEPADVLVADYVLVGALVAAEAVGIPTAALVHTVYPRPLPGRPPYGSGWMPAVGPVGRIRDATGTFVLNRLYATYALPALNLARTPLGLPPLRWYFAQFDRLGRVIVLTSPHFDFPARELPPNVRLVGTPRGEMAPAPSVPPWCEEGPRPRILVSLSTQDQGQAQLMARILPALAGLPLHAVVTLGPALPPSWFTPPPNVRLETFVPHAAILPYVDAMVTQCGLGTVMKALGHGVPLICMPLAGDQRDNAARVAARGAGIWIPLDTPLGRIQEAIQRVVMDPAYRCAARQIAARIAGEDAVQGAVDEIVSLAEMRPESGAR